MKMIKDLAPIWVTAVVVMVGLGIYMFIMNQPHLVGSSKSHVWKAEYVRLGTYWEGRLTRTSDEDITVKKFEVTTDGDKTDYSPSKAEAVASSFDFMLLGDRPKKDETFRIHIEWVDEKGSHSENFSLHRSYSLL